MLSSTPLRMYDALESFQRTMDIMVSAVKLKKTLSYLADVTMLFGSVKNRKAHLKLLLIPLREAGVAP